MLNIVSKNLFATTRSIHFNSIKVHAGFITDLASIPWVLTCIYSRIDTETWRAAILHDYMYSHKMVRVMADELFYDALVEFGCSRFKAKAMWLAVRLFGWIKYL